jgi:2'-5' RNA ligase
MIRIFIAFPIRDEIADSFLQVSKNNSQLENIRWTPKANLHITLFFIGEVDEENLGQIKNRLNEVCKEQRSFTLEFDSLVFKGRKHPSMLWAEFKKNECFSELSEKSHHAVKDYMTIVPSHADPLPHCTLARIKAGFDVSQIEINISIQQKNLEVNSAELWQTIQTKEGVRYECLHKYLMNP